MVQTDNKFLDDLAKLGQSAAGAVHGIKGEVEGAFRQKMENVLSHMDLVSREEFDVVREMAVLARAENEAMAKKIALLEEEVSKLASKPAPKPASKSAPKAKKVKK